MASPTAARGKYPRQIVIMASDETADAIIEAAERNSKSKSEVARIWLEAGRQSGEAVAERIESTDALAAAAALQ